MELESDLSTLDFIAPDERPLSVLAEDLRFALLPLSVTFSGSDSSSDELSSSDEEAVLAEGKIRFLTCV